MSAMTSTTFPDEFKDLLDQQVAALTTVGANGGPQTTLVWFLYDDGAVHVSLSDSRAKTKNLISRPLVSLMITDPANPYRYMDIRGTAVAEPDPDYVFADKVGAKYGGADLRERDQPGDTRYKITIADPKIYAVKMG
jgi:PPOX class probable F420-dependent enzyme